MNIEPQRNVYVGHRYVPKIFGEWNNEYSYEGLSIVTKGGASYTSKQWVPVGIDILNEEYWVITGNYNAQIEEYRKDVRDLQTYVDNEVTEIDKHIIEIERKLNDLVVNIKDFGAIPKEENATFDNTSIIQFLMDNLNKGQCLFVPSGEYLISNLKLEKDDVEIKCDGHLVQMKNSGGVALQIGRDNLPTYRVSGNVNLRKEVRDWTQQNEGLRVRNMNEAILTFDVHDFTVNTHIFGDTQGCSYNTFNIVNLKNGHDNLLFTRINEGWVNENKFFGGRFQWISGLPNTKKHVNMTVGNNNVFFSPSFESTDTGEFIHCGGSYNTFYSPRLEGRHNGETVINFLEGSIYNQIMYPYYHGNLFDTAEVINNGSRNHIYGRDTIEWQDTQIRPINIKIEGSLNRNLNWGSEGIIDVKSSGSNTHHLFHGRDVLGVETSKIDGLGNIEGRTITSRGGTFSKPSSDSNTAVVIEGKDFENNLLFQQTGDGTIRGKSRVNSLYNTFHFVPFAIKETSDVTGTPKEYDGTDAIGVAVLNTADSAIYVHMGGGVWKKSMLT